MHCGVPLSALPQTLKPFATLSGLHYLPVGLRAGALEFAAKLRLRERDTFLFEVAPHFADDIGIARRFEIRRDNRFGIGLRFFAGRKAQPLPSPHNPNSRLRRAVTRNLSSWLRL